MLWVFSLLTFLPVALTMLPGSYRVKELPTIPHTHVDVVSGAAACISFIGELFMIKVNDVPGLLGSSSWPCLQGLMYRSKHASGFATVSAYSNEFRGTVIRSM